MAANEESIPLEGLLAHEGFLSNLARHLVGNDQDAEDLVQDAWLASLQRPLSGGTNVRAWLRTVTRNRWLNRARRERERSRYERRFAQSEAVDSEEARIGLDRRQQVLAAVRSLPEPCMTTIFLRYYEERSIADVAMRMGVPAETARSRIQRGIELLRAKLDREFGSRASWVAFVGAWSRPIELQAPLPAVEAVGSGTSATAGWVGWVVFATSAMLVLMAVLRFPPESPVIEGGPLAATSKNDPPRAAVDSGSTASLRLPVPATGTDSAPAAEAGSTPREGPPSGDSPRAEPSHQSLPYHVTGRVLGANLLPVAGVEVYYGELTSETDDEGRFELRLMALSVLHGGKALTSPVPLLAVAKGAMPAVVPEFASRLLETDPAVPHRLELVLGGPTRSLSGMVRSADGRPAAGWQISLRDPSVGTVRDNVRIPLEALVSGIPILQRVAEDGSFRLEGLLDRPYDIIAWDPDSLTHVVAHIPAESAANLLLTAPDPADGRRVAGRIVSRTGVPLAHARVHATLVVGTHTSSLMEIHEAAGPATWSDEAGYFQLEHGAVGPLRLTVEAGEFLVRNTATDLMHRDPNWENLEVAVPLRCEIVLDAKRERPPAHMLAFLNEKGARLTIRLPEEDRAAMGGMATWPAIPLRPGPGRSILYVNEDARIALFYDYDGTEIERRPLHLAPDLPTVFTW